MLENFKQDCWLDFVIETLQGPIFIDCKSMIFFLGRTTNNSLKILLLKSLNVSKKDPS